MLTRDIDSDHSGRGLEPVLAPTVQLSNPEPGVSFPLRAEATPGLSFRLKAEATRLSIAVLAATLFAACARTAAQPADPGPPAVTAAKAVARDITELEEFTGRLEAVNTVAVRPRVSGYVQAVRFEEGTIVRRGDPLFLIDARVFAAEADRLRAELARAQATVRRATSESERADRLAKENAMTPEEHERRASFVQESAAQVAGVEAALRAAELNLEFTRVTSPIDGRVGRAIVTPGNLVSSGPGEATLMTTVVSIDPIYAAFDADGQTFFKHPDARPTGGKAGLPIHLALASDHEFSREGRMTFLDNQIDPATGTIRARAVFRNTDRSLTPGLFVRLQLPGSATYPGLLIQDRAVGTDLDKRFVYVVAADGTIKYRTVTLGPIVDGLRVVREGLSAGEVVVVSGLQRVRPGAKVAPVLVAMDAPPPAPGADDSQKKVTVQ
jgi:multidrug efflux system membrane fusion protein